MGGAGREDGQMKRGLELLTHASVSPGAAVDIPSKGWLDDQQDELQVLEE